MLSWRFALFWGWVFFAFTPPGRRHQRTVLAIGCKHTMKAGQVNPGFRHQRNQSRDGHSCASLRPRHTVHPVDKIQRFKNDMGPTVAPGFLIDEEKAEKVDTQVLIN